MSRSNYKIADGAVGLLDILQVVVVAAEVAAETTKQEMKIFLRNFASKLSTCTTYAETLYSISIGLSRSTSTWVGPCSAMDHTAGLNTLL